MQTWSHYQRLNNSCSIYQQLNLDKNVRVVRDLRRSFKLEKTSAKQRTNNLSQEFTGSFKSQWKHLYDFCKYFMVLMGPEVSLVDTVGFYVHVHCSILSRIIKDINWISYMFCSRTELQCAVPDTYKMARFLLYPSKIPSI